MAEPKIAGTRPIVLDVKPGTYYWCVCGESDNQPWCDGSHCDTEFEPLQFTIHEEKRFAFCTCKRSCNSPYCDGSHKELKPNVEEPKTHDDQ